jgi:hypothetical protein
MAQLKNTLFNFGTTQIGNYIVQDYSRNKIWQISSLPEVQDKTYVTEITLEDNQTIEAISYILYNNEDYWDILLAINGISPLFDMTYDFDVIKISSSAYANEYINNFGLGFSELTKTRLIEEFREKFLNQNEENRNFKVIKPNRMNDFLKILRDNGFAKKV